MVLPYIDFSKYDSVWFGENHGVKENYLAYRAIIPLLIEQGFATIAWEMPEDENIVYDDGRFSFEQNEFRSWLKELLEKGNISSINYIDSRNYVESQQDGESKMANNIITCVNKGKTIVASGNFHSQKRAEIVEGISVTPAAGLVEQAGYKIFTIGLSYASGTFYNFGTREFNQNFHCCDKKNNQFGTWLKNTNPLVDNDYWFCVGQAHAVTPTGSKDKTIK